MKQNPRNISTEMSVIRDLPGSMDCKVLLCLEKLLLKAGMLSVIKYAFRESVHTLIASLSVEIIQDRF